MQATGTRQSRCVIHTRACCVLSRCAQSGCAVLLWQACMCACLHVCLSCTSVCCCGGLPCTPPVHVCRACTAVCLLLRLTALGPGGRHSSWLCRLGGALQVFCQASPFRRQGWVCSCHCSTAACCWPLTPVYMYTSICNKLVDSPQDGSGWLPVCDGICQCFHSDNPFSCQHMLLGLQCMGQRCPAPPARAWCISNALLV